MSKKFKTLFLLLIVLVILIFIFLTIDYSRLKNNNKPFFSTSFGNMYLDGGTIEYYGIFYKIIDYNKVGGYDGIKVGTWFLTYDNSL